MKLTSKDANKLLKQYEEELSSVKCNEMYSKSWIASTTENREDVRPEYDYAAVQTEIQTLNGKIRKLRHAVNLFNTATVVPGFDKTIDEMLVYIPQLSAQKQKLADMKNCPKFERVAGVRSNSNFIEYRYINYDAKKAADDYVKVSDELTRAQLALDKVNITETFEVNI